MKTQSLKQFIIAPDSNGMNITAVCFCTFGAVLAISMSIIGFVRVILGFYTPAYAYFTAAGISLAVCLFSLYCIITQRVNLLAKLSYPFVAGGFIYGLTILFFLDGGTLGGVPIFFVLAVAATPFFLDLWRAVVMVCLEIAAYILNAVFVASYPRSINHALAIPSNAFIPVLIVALALGILCLLYNYAYRHQQVRLDNAISEAKSANEAKSSFLNNMSHEIRTPMNSILGMNEMILREEDRPEIKEYALVIQRSGRALLGIINDVLDFSKLQDKKMEIVAVRYDLSSLLNDMVNIAAEQAKKKSLTFTVNVDKEIPRILDGDEYHIRQVMLNILNNAIKYTERGGVTVTVGYETIDNYNIMLKFSVSDTGIGIKSEDLEYIFQPFEHIEASRRFSADGSGLGLPIVQKLLQLMGSDLKVESVFHKGSTFSFDVHQSVIKWEPIGDYERAFSTAAAHQTKKFTQSFTAPNAKVLVVDDADVNLLVFSNLLKFLVPLIIVGLVMPAIADIGKAAGRLLLITVLIAYSSTCLSALFSFGVSSSVFPHLIPTAGAEAALTGTGMSVVPYFTIAIPPLLDVMSALVVAFIVGLGCAYMGLPAIKAVADDFRKLIERTIAVLVIPLLPLYIFGIFAEMTFTGQAMRVVAAFASIILVIFVMHIVLLLVQFCIAGAVARKSPLKMLLTMLPAYFTALGTSSSAATIPVTFRQTVRLGVDEGVAGFTVPLCATIHMSGSAMKITACAVALMLMQGMAIEALSFVGFTLMLGIMMVASPGVPGGAIMASLGILMSMLGFSDQDCALMIALYIAMDSFGTACNVTGDGAIAVVVNKLHRVQQ